MSIDDIQLNFLTLKPKARRILGVMVVARLMWLDAWHTRRRLAGLLRQHHLTPYDSDLLEELVHLGFLETQKRRREHPVIPFVREYRLAPAMVDYAGVLATWCEPFVNPKEAV